MRSLGPCGACTTCCDRYYRKEQMNDRSKELAIWEAAFERRMLRAVVYVITLIFIAFFGFINLIFGVKFTSAQNNAWLTSVGIGAVSGECMCVCV
jgi:hypothetical protein